MAEKKQESFTVTDRRLFTPDGELRKEVSEEEIATSKPATAAPSAPPSTKEAVPAAEAASTLDASVPRLQPQPNKKSRPTPTASRLRNLMHGSS